MSFAERLVLAIQIVIVAYFIIGALVSLAFLWSVRVGRSEMEGNPAALVIFVTVGWLWLCFVGMVKGRFYLRIGKWECGKKRTDRERPGNDAD